MPAEDASPASVGRRTLLLGGTAATLLAATGLALEQGRWQPVVRRVLKGDPVPPPAVPVDKPGSRLDGSLPSAAMGRAVGWSIGYPPGSAPGARLPMLLVMHGRGDDHRAVFGRHALGAFLSAAVRAGVPPYALVSVDGGDHSYWHKRLSGEDPQAMIVDELLPLLERRGLVTGRIGVGGWSMGGYGALLLAERLGPSRIAVVVADSPAIWSHAGDTAAGAFDGRADFLAHDVVRQHRGLGGIPVRIACGREDPFLPGVKALLGALPGAGRELGPGGHNVAFWQRAAPRQLAFAGRHLVGT